VHEDHGNRPAVGRIMQRPVSTPSGWKLDSNRPVHSRMAKAVRLPAKPGPPAVVGEFDRFPADRERRRLNESRRTSVTGIRRQSPPSRPSGHQTPVAPVLGRGARTDLARRATASRRLPGVRPAALPAHSPHRRGPSPDAEIGRHAGY
jgi:hypothetical protein